MNGTLNESKLLLNNLRNYALYLEQLERLYIPLEFERKISKLVKFEKLFEYKTIKKGLLYEINLHTIGEDTILNERYLFDVANLLTTLSETIRLGRYQKRKVDVLKSLIQKEALCDYYNIKRILSDYENLEIVFSDLSFEDSAYLMGIILDFLECNQIYIEDVSELFKEKLSEELEFYIDHIDYMTLVESYCDPQSQNEVLQENHKLIIEEIYQEIQSLILGINNCIITSSVKDRFATLMGTIEFHINDVFEELSKESNKPIKRNLSETSVSVDDILDRPI